MKNNQIFYYIHPLDRIQLLRITKIGNIIIYKINNSAVILYKCAPLVSHVLGLIFHYNTNTLFLQYV